MWGRVSFTINRHATLCSSHVKGIMSPDRLQFSQCFPGREKCQASELTVKTDQHCGLFGMSSVSNYTALLHTPTRNALHGKDHKYRAIVRVCRVVEIDDAGCKDKDTINLTGEIQAP